MSSKARQILILLGPPGSGKGTQATRLSKTLNLPHISTGDLFRGNIKNGTALGHQVKKVMDSGNLVSDELVLAILFDRIGQKDCEKGYLLDGFPRTIPQAEAFDKRLSKGSKVCALNLLVKDENIVKRIAGRLTCKSCGTIYNHYFSPSAKEGVCDKCHGELTQRADDNAAVVEERLRVYHKQTEPLIDFYAKKNCLFNVDGEQSSDQVYQNLSDLMTSSTSPGCHLNRRPSTCE